MVLSSLDVKERPDPSLEQYLTPVDLATDVVIDAYRSGDIEGKIVADLGCGSGILSFASNMLGASSVVGFDIDPESVEIARNNMFLLKRHPKYESQSGEVKFIQADVDNDNFKWESVDTVVMNPPFGAQKKGADRSFIRRSVQIAKVVYAIHNGKGIDFVRREYERQGGEVVSEKGYIMKLGSRFVFHTKRSVDIKVSLFKVVCS